MEHVVTRLLRRTRPAHAGTAVGSSGRKRIAGRWATRIYRAPAGAWEGSEVQGRAAAGGIFGARLVT